LGFSHSGGNGSSNGNCGQIFQVRYLHSNTVAGPADLAAKLFFTHVVKIFGRPEDIVSDRDPKFTGRFSTALFNLMGFDLKFFTSYPLDIPQSREVCNISSSQAMLELHG